MCDRIESGDTMKIGLIDLGANSIRLVVYQVTGDTLTSLLNTKQHAQSALYIVNNKMTQEGIELIVTVVHELIDIAKKMDLDYFKIFATDSLRDIDNQKEAVSAIESMIHYPIDVLSDQDETMYGFEGVKKKQTLPEKGILIDIGGASLELTYFENEIAKHTKQIGMGSLTLYDNFVYELIPKENEQQAIRNHVFSMLSEISWLKEIKGVHILAIGGSARALLRLSRDIQKRSILQTPSTLSKEQMSHLSSLDIKASKVILKAAPNRLITIIPAAILLDELMNFTSANTIEVSDYGVREGYLYKKILSKNKSSF